MLYLYESEASHVGTATCSLLCALLAPSKPGCGRALRTAVERSARRTPVSSWRIVRLAQSVPALVEWLRCCSYAKTFVNTFPQCGFLHWYPIMRREAGALNASASIVGLSIQMQVRTIPIRKLVVQILSTHVFLIRIEY